MRCVSLLLLLLCLLLPALDPFAAAAAAAAAAHRELLMPATGDEQNAKLDRTQVAAKDADQATRKRKEESTKWRHFRTRKLPSDAKNRFGGRAPFAADYSGIQSSPSKHH